MSKDAEQAAARPTITDVARHAGVSKGLVSFALNDRPGVSAETRDRILASAEELGWTPSLRARSLSVDRSYALGLVIGRSVDVIAADPFFHAFIAGVESEFSTAGQVLVLAQATPGREEAATYRGLAADKRVDGVFLTDLRAGDERIALVRELGLAAVTLGHPDVPSPFPAVSVDDGRGIRAAVEHLVDLGHRRIAHVAGPSNMLHGRRARRRLRRRRHRRAASSRPRSSRPTSAPSTVPAPPASSSRSAPTGRPRSCTRTTTWRSPGSPSRNARASACRTTSRSPASTTPTSREHTFPSITSVATDAADWGARSARLLLAAIAKQPVEDVDLSEPRLVVRESTATAPEPAPHPNPHPTPPRIRAALTPPPERNRPCADES